MSTRRLLRLITCAALLASALGVITAPGVASAHEQLLSATTSRPCAADEPWSAVLTAEASLADPEVDWRIKVWVDDVLRTDWTPWVATADRIDVDLSPLDPVVETVVVKVVAEWGRVGTHEREAIKTRTLDVQRPDAAGCATLDLEKRVSNPAGGTAAPGDFRICADGPDELCGFGRVTGQVSPGTYTLTESGPDGYDLTSLECDGVAGGVVEVAAGDLVSCVFTNTQRIEPVSLTLRKIVRGGTASAGQFRVCADGPDELCGDGGATGPVEWGRYVFSESGRAGYDLTSLDCTTGAGRVALSPDDPVLDLVAGDVVDCTFTNTYSQATVSLAKVVALGPDSPDDFEVCIVGPARLCGIGAATGDVPPGSYVFEEQGPDGYDLSVACDAGLVNGVLTVAPGDVVNCTLTNTLRPTRLTLEADPIGGDTPPDAWEVCAIGAVTFCGAGSATREVVPGPFTLTQSDPDPGYRLVTITCTDAASGDTTELELANPVVHVGAGADVTCRFANAYRLAPLAVGVEVLDPDDPIPPDEFEVCATGAAAVCHAGAVAADVEPGRYSLSATGPPDYVVRTIVCTRRDGSDASPAVARPEVEVVLGDALECTIGVARATAVLTLAAEVVGGDAAASAWTLSAVGELRDNRVVGRPPVTGDIRPDTFTLTQVDPEPGYELIAIRCADRATGRSWALDLGDPRVVVAAGSDITCTFTNRYRLARVVLVASPLGGDAPPSAWTLCATGPTRRCADGELDARVEPGVYDLTQSRGPEGYELTAIRCDSSPGDRLATRGATGVRVSLSAGEEITCTFVNEYQLAELSLLQWVVGGDAPVPGWEICATGPSTMCDPGPDPVEVVRGVYRFSERSLPPGYVTATPDHCFDRSTGHRRELVDGTIRLEPEDDVACAFVATKLATLTLTALEPRNDDGGGATADAWQVCVDLTCASRSLTVSIRPGERSITQRGPFGYDTSGWSCTGGGELTGLTIELSAGEDVTCTTSGDDRRPRLTLVAEVRNDHGGTASADAWTVCADRSCGARTLTSGLDAGTHVITADGPDGYTTSGWSCGRRGVLPGRTIALAPGDIVTCTATGDDIAAQLTLRAVVIGGPGTAADWTLTADGPAFVSVAHGATGSVPAGSYELGERDELIGPPSDGEAWLAYTAANGPGDFRVREPWSCETADGTIAVRSIELALSDEVTCTVTLEWSGSDPTVPPRLTMRNVVDGGPLQDEDWVLRAELVDAATPTHHEAPGGFESVQLAAGDHRLSERSDLPGAERYATSGWTCVETTQDGDEVPRPTREGDLLALGSGDVVTCTITNTYLPPDVHIVAVDVICSRGEPFVSYVLGSDGAAPAGLVVALEVDGVERGSVAIDDLDGWLPHPGTSDETFVVTLDGATVDTAAVGDVDCPVGTTTTSTTDGDGSTIPGGDDEPDRGTGPESAPSTTEAGSVTRATTEPERRIYAALGDDAAEVACTESFNYRIGLISTSSRPVEVAIVASHDRPDATDYGGVALIWLELPDELRVRRSDGWVRDDRDGDVRHELRGQFGADGRRPEPIVLAMTAGAVTRRKSLNVVLHAITPPADWPDDWLTGDLDEPTVLASC